MPRRLVDDELAWRRHSGKHLFRVNNGAQLIAFAGHVARIGRKTYSKPEADRALGLTLDFFTKHLR